MTEAQIKDDAEFQIGSFVRRVKGSSCSTRWAFFVPRPQEIAVVRLFNRALMSNLKNLAALSPRILARC